jgi:hypothetical protein
MDAQLLESLLHQEESETLDFKRDQYLFDGASDEEKSELLKDILAFANSWRETDAHILIGVEEVRGGRSIIRGVAGPILNRNLQQFVHSKTNRPVDFSYAPVTFEGLEIGVITIPVQERPVFLRQKYGNLQPNVVYIRRRDTTGQADPDEVAKMGFHSAESEAQPVLDVSFVLPDTRKPLGLIVPVDVTLLELPAQKMIPLYGKELDSFFGVHMRLADSMVNRKYYREFGNYLSTVALHSGFGIAITSQSVAKGILVTLEFDVDAKVSIIGDDEMPHPPSTSLPLPFVRGFSGDRYIDVQRFGNVVEIRVEFEAVQPGETGWSKNSFFVGARSSQTVSGRGRITAHNLRKPKTFDASFEIQTTDRKMWVADLTKVADDALNEK